MDTKSALYPEIRKTLSMHISLSSGDRPLTAEVQNVHPVNTVQMRTGHPNGSLPSKLKDFLYILYATVDTLLSIRKFCMSAHKVNNSDAAQKLRSDLGITKRLLVRLIKIQLKNPVTDFCGRIDINTKHICGFRFYGRELMIGYKHCCKLKNRISRTKRISYGCRILCL